MQKEMRLLPIDQVAVLKTEREAMRACLDAYNASKHDPRDTLTDPQWAALLSITKGQLSEYLGGNGDKPKHIPEHIREKVERLTGFKGITQFHALKDNLKLMPIDEGEAIKAAEAKRKAVEAENRELRKQLELVAEQAARI